jgi:uncharacterized membrane protein YkvA (DUF1232 family)
MPLLSDLRQRARDLKTETIALYLAARHPDTPWYAKLLVAGIAAYALSPIDLIPDFIPILGYLDDLILIPLGIVLAVRMIPPPILEECRARARDIAARGRPVSRIAGAVIVVLWIALGTLFAAWVYAVWIAS